ncbi:MAG TPA: carbohydrate binding domain-containing protein [Candidatus Limnocylindrales bacterium]|nr:carbohydrate binding domain-containing protein [Candidatus Limnocylindrales bacterium]
MERRPRPPSPEFIGGVSAVAIILLITAVALGVGPGRGSPTTPGGGGSAAPSQAVATAEPTPTPPVDPAVVRLLRSLNDRLEANADALQAELDRSRFRADAVQSIVRQVNTFAPNGSEAVKALGGALGKDEPGGKLAALYLAMADSASKTLNASVNNNPEAYRLGAVRLVALIRQLPELQKELDVLAVPPTPGPSRASPSPSPTPTPTATPVPTPTPTAAPTGSPASSPTETMPVATGPEQVANGGFEEGVGQPWQLFLGPSAAATLAADKADAGAGTSSARIDITTGSPAYAGISLRQAGLSLEAGQQYALTVSMRSTAVRDVRVRVASSGGAQYFGRVVSVTPQWSTQTFVFTASVGDPAAVLELDVGRAEATTWFDGVSFRPVGS